MKKNIRLKTVVILTIILVIIASLSSCATSKSYAEFSRLNNLQRHRIENYQRAKRVVRVESAAQTYTDLDIARLKAQPVKADPVKGFEGKIANLTRWQNVQFIISRVGADRVILSEYLAPGQQVTRNLLPGTYTVIMKINGQIKDRAIFTVNSEIKHLFGEPYHWYVLRDREY
jgi:ABC-type protease/lipase transport system fused ATPase/permease subunit